MGDTKEEKKSIWQSFKDRKKSVPISDEDLKKYTGMSRQEFDVYKDNTPGVGRNQLSGKLAMGNANGFVGSGAAGGLGGWGPGAEPDDGKRGMKFPPQKVDPKKLEDTD